jgi:hypothetical protein
VMADNMMAMGGLVIGCKGHGIDLNLVVGK